jgi:hypothetical protein
MSGIHRHHGHHGGHAGVWHGGHRVLIDPDELERLADGLDHAEDVTRWAQATVQRVKAELQLAGAHAPTRARAGQLDALLDEPLLELPPLAAALGRDEGLVRSIRHRALLADDARPLLPPAKVERLLDSLRGKLRAETLARLEVMLLGGLALHRRPRRHLPIVSHGDRLPAAAAAGGGDRRRHPASSRAAKVRDVVHLAKKQVGYHERGDNLTKYGAWYGLNGQPWCGMFVSWVFAKSGHRLPHLQSDKGFAGVRAAAQVLRRRGLLRRRPKAGDLYLHRGATWQSDHTGIVIKVERDGDFWTVEGNKGDRVQRVFHRHDEGSMFGFGRVL